PTEEQVAAELANAEESAWAYYLEWSRISRVAVRDRTLLRQLGFLNVRRMVEEEEEAEAEPDEPTSVVPPAPPVPAVAASAM
ncbi:MAG: hypothetical protein WBM17_17405, partial [Anaerolineales bacterium]